MTSENESFQPAYKVRAKHIAEFARTFSVTHALTVQPGYVNPPGLDPERYLAPLLGRLLETYARYGRGQSRIRKHYVDPATATQKVIERLEAAAKTG